MSLEACFQATLRALHDTKVTPGDVVVHAVALWPEPA